MGTILHAQSNFTGWHNYWPKFVIADFKDNYCKK